MVQGALLCPGLPGKTGLGDARAIVRRFALAHRAARSASSGTGLSRYGVSRLICGPAPSARSRSGSRLALRYWSLRSGTGSTGTRWSGRRLGRPVGRRISGRGAKVGTFRCGRWSAIGLSLPSAAGGGHRAAGPYQPGRLGLPSRCRASKPTSHTRLPIVWSSMIWRSWPSRPSVMSNSQRPAYAASWLADGPAQPRTQRLPARTTPHLSVKVSGFVALPRQLRTALPSPVRGCARGSAAMSNPQNVRRADLLSRRDRNRS